MATTIKITGQMHKVLGALNGAKKPLTRKEIMAAAFNGNSINMKPVLDPLVAEKLVKGRDRDVDGKIEVVFEITAPGKKAAAAPAPTRGVGKTEHQPLPKVGGTVTKEYKGKTITLKVLAEGFQIGKDVYKSLTAAAKAVRGSDKEINGWLFFGLTK